MFQSTTNVIPKMETDRFSNLPLEIVKIEPNYTDDMEVAIKQEQVKKEAEDLDDDFEENMKQEEINLCDNNYVLKEDEVGISESSEVHGKSKNIFPLRVNGMEAPNTLIRESITTKQDIDNVEVAIKQEEIDIPDFEFKIDPEKDDCEHKDTFNRKKPINLSTSLANNPKKRKYPYHKKSDKVTVHKCNVCQYRTTRRKYFKLHQKSKHHRCESCTFLTVHLNRFKSHLLTHKEPDEVTMFNGNECKYETKGNVPQRNEVEHYECENCNFRTRNKNSLRIHKKWHVKVKVKCNTCDFTTKHKNYLKSHEKLHLGIDEVEHYKCESCDFRTRHKTSLKNHKNLHLSIDEVERYTCETCGFQTRHKTSLKHHQRMHLSLDKVEYHECIICGFQTKNKNYLKKHETGHSSVELYKCAMCDYQTKRKSYLKKHEKSHTTLLDDVEYFECETCGFQTKNKNYINQHKMLHLVSLDEVEHYKCGYCDYQTIHRSNLKTHLLVHRNLIK